MLKEINAINWENYEDAYGQAQEIPHLLTNLIKNEDKSWFDIWSHLCHQGTVYSATFIAMPFIVDLFEKTIMQSKNKFDFYLFPASVEIFFPQCQVEIDVFNLNQNEIHNYYNCLEKLDNLVPQFLKDNTNEDCILSALAYQAIRSKQVVLAEFLMNVDKNQLPNILDKVYG
jgi:hypothetical protein